MLKTNKYSKYKIVWFPNKLKSIRDHKTTPPIYIRIKPINACNNRCKFCLRKGTMILTPTGSKPIEEIKIGDKVIAGNKSIKEVTNIFKHNVKEIYKLDVQYLPTIYATGEHPFHTVNKYTPLKNIKKGHKIKVLAPSIDGSSIRSYRDKGKTFVKEKIYVSSFFKDKRYHSKRRNSPAEEIGRFRVRNSKYSCPQIIRMDFDLGRFWGLYLAEGCIISSKDRPNSKVICISLNKNETEYAEFIKKVGAKLGFKVKGNIYPYKTDLQLIINNSIFANLIELTSGNGGAKKRFPKDLNFNINFARGLIRGLFDGDGCYKDYSFTSTNKQMYYELLEILLANGFIPITYKRKEGSWKIEGRTGKSMEAYYLRISTKDIKRFKEFITDVPITRKNSYKHEFNVKVVSNKKISTDEEVYNIEVDKESSYFAEFMLCHNCSYVYSVSNMHKDMKKVDMIPHDKMMEIMEDLRRMKVKCITLSGGGEPLIYPWIEEVLDFANKNKILTSIITNGLSLDGNKAKLLKVAKWVRVSADYCDEEEYSKFRRVPKENFFKVIENIKNFNKIRKGDLEINFIVHKGNINTLVEAATLFKEAGVDNIRFSPVWYPNFFRYHKSISKKFFETLPRLRKLENKKFKIFESFTKEYSGGADNVRHYKTCPMMQILPVIAADQCVYTCHNKAYDPLGRIGSIKHRAFRTLWYDKKTADFFRKFKPNKWCKHQCTNDAKNKIINEMMEAGDCFV